MRTIFLLWLIFFCNRSFGQLKSVSIQVSGLTCAMCSRTVQKSLEKVSFVKEVKPNIKALEYAITFKDNDTVDFEVLKSAVEDAGFSLARFQFSGIFDEVQVKKGSVVLWNHQNYYFLNADNETLSGLRTLTIVEKDFLSASRLKKYCNDLKFKCPEPVKTQNANRVYHVVI